MINLLIILPNSLVISLGDLGRGQVFFYRESVDGAVSTVFRTPPYLVLAVELGSPDREKITCIDPVASCKENASAHFF